MVKDSPTKQPKTGSNSPFRKFEQLAKKIVTVPKSATNDKAGKRSA